jgi:hypothetical protein
LSFLPLLKVSVSKGLLSSLILTLRESKVNSCSQIDAVSPLEEKSIIASFPSLVLIKLIDGFLIDLLPIMVILPSFSILLSIILNYVGVSLNNFKIISPVSFDNFIGLARNAISSFAEL